MPVSERLLAIASRSSALMKSHWWPTPLLSGGMTHATAWLTAKRCSIAVIVELAVLWVCANVGRGIGYPRASHIARARV